MSGSPAEDVAEPGPGVSPFLASEVDGDAEGCRDLLVAQAGELAELDHLGRDRVLTRQPIEGVVEGEASFVRVGCGYIGEVDSAVTTAPLLPGLAPASTRTCR